jgi:hypothetical protein
VSEPWSCRSESARQNQGPARHASIKQKKMKKAIGSILCILAILRIINLSLGPKADTTAHRVQDWALVGVLLAIGIPLSSTKKMPPDSSK